MTAYDLIRSSLRLINALAADEPLDDSMANDALVTFNQMVDSWNADSLAIFTTRTDDFPFIANQQDYTLGAGGDFNMPRPARIDSMSAIILDNPTNPVEIPLACYTVDDWQNKIPVKAVSSSFPQIYYDTGDFPLRKIKFWPYPNTNQNKVRIYSWQALTQPATLQTDITFPPGYAEAFRFNLALRLAPEYSGSPVSSLVIQTATESLARVKTMNAPSLELQSDLVPTADNAQMWRAEMFGIPY